MKHPTTIRELIDLWPSRKALAEDVSTTLDRVHKWAVVGAIPARFHFAVIEAAKARGFSLSADTIVTLHKRADAPATDRGAA